HCFSLSLPLLPPTPPLFPYTTLFRSICIDAAAPARDAADRNIPTASQSRYAAPAHLTTAKAAAEAASNAARPNAATSVCTTQPEDRKSTRLNSSHDQISYAVLCLKKK